MPQLKVAIITEKLGTYDAASSTVIADEALARKHKIFEFEANNLRFEDGKLFAKAWTYPSKKIIEINLEKMDVILFRPNPPVDMAYLTTLFMLRTIEHKVMIINRPTSVINFPEKIFPLYLAKFMPPTLITSDNAAAQAFAKKHGNIIVKPLYDFGGNDVMKVESGKAFKLNGKTPQVVQKFIPQIVKGDKRILFVNYKYNSVFRRVPKKGSYIANIAQGGELQKTTLSKTEKEICRQLEPLLKKNDIRICGIDVINDRITEINITSPTGFTWANNIYGTNPEKTLWDGIERALNNKRS